MKESKRIFVLISEFWRGPTGWDKRDLEKKKKTFNCHQVLHVEATIVAQATLCSVNRRLHCWPVWCYEPHCQFACQKAQGLMFGLFYDLYIGKT